MEQSPEAGPHRFLAAAALGAAALILTLQVLVPPIVGLANNGDFEKVLGYAGLRYGSELYADKYNTHIVREFRFAPVWYRSGYLSSETALARVARDLARPFARSGLFDIRVLGAIHALLLLLALAGLLRACRYLTWQAQLVAASLLVFFFTDVGYAALFNTFYTQTAAFLFLMLAAAAIALAVRRSRLDGALGVAYFLCAAAFVASKPQESIHGPLFALFGLRLAGIPRGAWRRPAEAMAAALVLFSLWSYGRTPEREIRRVALYQTVFRDMLPESADPGTDLAALGLDRRLAVYSGTNAYQPGAPIDEPGFERDFFDRIGYGKVVLFYAARPDRLLGRLERAARKGGLRLRPHASGNFEKTAPGWRPNLVSRRFAAWSGLRLKAAPAAAPWLAALLCLNLLAAAVGWKRSSRRGRLLREAIAFFVTIAVVEFLVCALADGLADIARHLFVFQAICDLLLVADAVWIAQVLAVSGKRGREPARGG